MNSKTLDFLCFFIVFTLGIVLGFFLLLAYQNGSISSVMAKLSLDEPNNLTCNQSNLKERANCLKSELSEWYNYNLTNKEKELSDLELKTEGGVCWHYTDWYESQLKDINTKKVTIKVNETATHRFLVASFNDTFCVLDQMVVRCW